VGFDTPQTLGDKQTGAVVAGPIWRDFMDLALKDTAAHDFRVPDGVTIDSWGCGSHDCVDAFKPDQIPGDGGVGGADAPGQAAGSVSMMDAVPGAQPDSAAAAPAQGSGTGVDSGVGGLY
jgi:penicillin-binding protein 1A